MRSHYKNKNTLKNLPFYSEETNNIKKKTAKNLLTLNFYLNYYFFLKKLKNKKIK